MNKETVEKKLKYELELLKIYSFFIALTGTGTAGLLSSVMIHKKVNYF